MMGHWTFSLTGRLPEGCPSPSWFTYLIHHQSEEYCSSYMIIEACKVPLITRLFNLEIVIKFKSCGPNFLTRMSIRCTMFIYDARLTMPNYI